MLSFPCIICNEKKYWHITVVREKNNTVNIHGLYLVHFLIAKPQAISLQLNIYLDFYFK